MSKLVELEKLDRAVKDAEIRLRTVKTNLDAIEKELDILSLLETQLEENVKVLKEINIIAIATEYKKAKQDLTKTKNSLINIKNTKENYKKAYSDIESFLKKSKEEIEKLNKSGENNVLRGKFGRKNG